MLQNNYLIILFNPTLLAPCLGANPEYKGDGYCDDDLNNENCEFDGGDCCLNPKNTEYCTDCECIEPTEEGKGVLILPKVSNSVVTF